MEIAFLDRINAASLAAQVTGLSHRPLFLSQKRQTVNLDAIALGEMPSCAGNLRSSPLLIGVSHSTIRDYEPTRREKIRRVLAARRDLQNSDGASV
jgi:hypothetical protein